MNTMLFFILSTFRIPFHENDVKSTSKHAFASVPTTVPPMIDWCSPDAKHLLESGSTCRAWSNRNHPEHILGDTVVDLVLEKKEAVSAQQLNVSLGHGGHQVLQTTGTQN